MEWYAVYNTSTGKLFCIGTYITSSLPSQFSVRTYPEKPDNGKVWDEVAMEFVDAPPVQEGILKIDFMRRFTPEERVAIRTAAQTDQVLVDIEELLRAAQKVRLNHPDTIYGINYLVSVGLLTQARADEILQP